VTTGAGSITINACGSYDFQVYSIAPVLPNGWTLLGEPDKWVHVSSARFRDLSYDGNGVSLARLFEVKLTFGGSRLE
jgi:hypothetical protein